MFDRKEMALGVWVALLALAVLTPPAWAQGLEKPAIKLAVGGKSLLYYLPLTIAERKGFFKAEGLDMEIADFAGGAKSLQALVGGSVDVVTGAYEHTVRMQAKGQDIRCVIELGRFPGIVLGVGKAKAATVATVADLKGLKIGVTAPGSSTDLLTKYALFKSGLAITDASFIGIGGGASAVAALRNGQIDAISNLEPTISVLEQSGDIKVLVDTRTEAGTIALFGGSNPAACLYLKQEFIEKNPKSVQAMVNALYKALKFIETATPDEIAATVPEPYLLGDKALYMAAFKNTRDTYSKNGIVSEAGMASTSDMLTKFDAELKSANVDLARTFDGRFAKQAALSVK